VAHPDSATRPRPDHSAAAPGERPLPITALVLTHNEEQNLPRCLESLVGWLDEVIVVDSGSTDATLAIAERFRCRVVQHPFETHAAQWTWALQTIACRNEWLLGLDADQRVSPELKEEMRRVFTGEPGSLARLDGFFLKRRQIFRGRWIRHGGYYPKYLLKLVRRSRVWCDPDDLVDHHFYVPGGVAYLDGDLIEENQKEEEIGFWIEKHNRYASLLAQEELHRRAVGSGPLRPALFGNADQRVLWRKRLWRSLPAYVRPFFYFCYRYVLRLGFLDGKEGFVFHFLHAWWFRLLVDIKVEEESRARKP
jgi:glycosyltransferase involved in cell wall biosynthesis